MTHTSFPFSLMIFDQEKRNPAVSPPCGYKLPLPSFPPSSTGLSPVEEEGKRRDMWYLISSGAFPKEKETAPRDEVNHMSPRSISRSRPWAPLLPFFLAHAGRRKKKRRRLAAVIFDPIKRYSVNRILLPIPFRPEARKRNKEEESRKSVGVRCLLFSQEMEKRTPRPLFLVSFLWRE